MKKFFLAFLIFLFSTIAVSQDLVEFSTSMDFEEFEVVLKYLDSIDKALAQEISTKIQKFKKSSTVGQSQKFKLDTIDGYMILEREDDYAFGIATFTAEETHTKIDDAYDQGTEELGI